VVYDVPAMLFTKGVINANPNIVIGDLQSRKKAELRAPNRLGDGGDNVDKYTWYCLDGRLPCLRIHRTIIA